MGYVKARAAVWNPEDPSKGCEVEFLADTGAIYTILPSSLLESLGIRRRGKRRFRLADNRVIERDVGFIGIRVGDREAVTVTVFGDEGLYILGVTALEELGLEVDPITGELKEMELLLLPFISPFIPPHNK